MAHGDGYEYVRSYYKVPAYVGVKVKVEGRSGVLVKPKHGGQYVDILFDGDKRPTGPFHPNDMVYLIESGRSLAAVAGTVDQSQADHSRKEV